MKISRRHILGALFIVFLSVIFTSYQLDYYIYTPGSADVLTDMVEIEDSYPAEGAFHLVTVSSIKATIPAYITAKIRPFHEIVKVDDAKPKELSDEEYHQYQLKMMDNSQQSSRYVAYKAAGKPAEIKFNGVFVMRVVEGMPAEGHIEVGDRITAVDGKAITTGNDLINYLQTKQADSEITVELIRNDEKETEIIQVAAFPDQGDKVGIGIQLVNDQEVVVEPDISFKSGNIGGPSAGLMFSLEIYNRLTEADITKGYNIAGTGEMDYDGSVLAIGGADKKVVAADKEGIDIFFVPNENGRQGSNYEEAKEAAEEIKTSMEIVPVDTFEEALTYLESLEPKK